MQKIVTDPKMILEKDEHAPQHENKNENAQVTKFSKRPQDYLSKHGRSSPTSHDLRIKKHELSGPNTDIKLGQSVQNVEYSSNVLNT